MTEPDYYELDTCACGGTYACWTYRLSDAEMATEAGEYRHFSSWFCLKCGDLDYKHYDEEMNDVD